MKMSLERGMRIGAMAIVAGVLASGCVNHPYDDANSTADRPEVWEGFSEYPSSPVEIQAYNQATRQWQTIKTTTSDATLLEWGGLDLYRWRTTVTLTTDAPGDYRCFLDSDCAPGAVSHATWRVRAGRDLFTYREPGPNQGVLCANDKVLEGLSAYDAYQACNPPDRNTRVRLRYIDLL